MATLFQWLVNITGFLAGLALTVVLFVLLPLSIARRTRSFAGQGIIFASWVWGIALWMSATAILLNLWGFWGFVIGVVLLGVGSVPVAAFASLINREWAYLGGLAIGVLVVYGMRILSVWLLGKASLEVGGVDDEISLIKE
jgi:hypothetical protein